MVRKEVAYPADKCRYVLWKSRARREQEYIRDNLDSDHQAGASSPEALTEVLRTGAQRLLAKAIEAEIQADLADHREFLDDHGRHRVIRNGHSPEREVQTGIGPETEEPTTTLSFYGKLGLEFHPNNHLHRNN